MSRITILSYYNNDFFYASNLLKKSLKHVQHDYFILRKEREFRRTEFAKKNRSVAFQKKGSGYWLWKPYYIAEQLKIMEDGDVLIYIDSGVAFTNDVQELVSLVRDQENGILLFENYQGSYQFKRIEGLPFDEYNIYQKLNCIDYSTKEEVFTSLNISDNKIRESFLVDAAFMMFCKNNSSISFVNHWLNLCTQEILLTDLPDQKIENKVSPYFGHRHDQSILSVLAAQWGIELFRCPTQTGNHFKLVEFRIKGEYLLLPYSSTPKTNSPYGTKLNHHRIRFKNTFWVRLKHFLSQEKKALLGI